MDHRIEKIDSSNFHEWLKMGLALWPDNSEEELREDFSDLLSSDNEESFIFRIEDEYVGFINLSVRSDYVEGSNSSPVGYVEGIYVRPEYRCQGIGKRLLEAGEQWALKKGCNEMGSDCELHNTISYDFHMKAGFSEANRIISFIKDIENQ